MIVQPVKSTVIGLNLLKLVKTLLIIKVKIRIAALEMWKLMNVYNPKMIIW